MRKCCAIKIFNYKRVNLSKGLELIKDGGTFAVGMAANFFLMPLNKIIIARYVGFSEVAYYEIGLRVVLAIRNIFFKGLEALLPKFGASHKVFLHYNEKVISVHKKGLKLVINFALPLFIMIFIFSTPLLKFWLGDKFNLQISVITKILLVGWFMNLLAAPEYFMFIGIGKVKYVAIEEWSRALCNIALIVICIIVAVNFSAIKLAIISSISLIFGFAIFKFLLFRLRRSSLNKVIS